MPIAIHSAATGGAAAADFDRCLGAPAQRMHRMAENEQFRHYRSASTDRGRRYNNDKGCLTQLSFTTFYTLTRSPQCIFCTAKVNNQIYRLFTVGSRYRYFGREPVPGTNPTLILYLRGILAHWNEFVLKGLW